MTLVNSGASRWEMGLVRLRGAPESIVDHGKGKLNILCETVNTDSLDNGVDLMAPPGALTLLVVVHDTVLDLYIRVCTASAVSLQGLTIILGLYLVV